MTESQKIVFILLLYIKIASILIRRRCLYFGAPFWYPWKFW